VKRLFESVLALSLLLLVGIMALRVLLVTPSVSLNQSTWEIQLILIKVSAAMVAASTAYYRLLHPAYSMVHSHRITKGHSIRS